MNERVRQFTAQHGLAEGVVLLALTGWWLTAKGLPAFVLPTPVAVLGALAQFSIDPFCSTISQ